MSQHMSQQATAEVRQAAQGPVVKRLARLGLAARGGIYLLIGVLAVALATGSRSAETDQQGALENLTRHTGGALLVWVIAVGLFGYALWRFSEAAFGVVGEGKKTGPRLQSAARGIIYASLAVTAVKVASGSGGSSQSSRQESWSAQVMAHAGGRWLVGGVGVAVVVCGAVLIWEGFTHRFEKYLDRASMDERTRTVVRALGTVGTAARGVVFGLAGVFVVVAAVTVNPDKAGGIDQALRELRDTTAGPVLLGVVALGLVAFGLYGFAEARWRRT